MNTEYPCQYVVIKFLRNPIREEPRNVGIILQSVEAQFVSARMVDDLEGLDLRPSDIEVISLYADWGRGLERYTSRGDVLFYLGKELDGEFLQGLSASSHGASIQFSEVRGCVTADPLQMLNDLYEMLVVPEASGDATASDDQRSKLFSKEFYSYLQQIDPETTSYLKRLRRFEIGAIKLAFDYSYARPGNRGWVLYQTLDLTKASSAQRVRIASPTIMKFSMITNRYGRERYTKNVVVKDMLNESLHASSEEMAVLRDSSDEIFRFHDEADMHNLLAGMRRDLRYHSAGW